MKQEKITAGFIGAGGIARSHAYSLASLRYFYNDPPEIDLESVCSQTISRRESFAAAYKFRTVQTLTEFLNNKKIDTVYILGPNSVHYEHLKAASAMPSVKRIYLEKPVCSTAEEERGISDLVHERPDIRIQVGFQYLFSTNIREAFLFWNSGVLGKPVHFDIKYYHGDYLQESYRSKRKNRLTPAPDGGAMADLGSHAISLIIAFLGDELRITSALQSGSFKDVPDDSDLFSLINLYDLSTGAAGTISASRISSGTGDLISFELYCEKGALKFSTFNPCFFEYYLEETGVWTKKITGSNYRQASSFPSVHVPPGWLRSMVHAHYVFLTGNKDLSFVPDIRHGLSVQRLVRLTADNLVTYRHKIKEFK